MEYTINTLAKLSGVSTRTLRYYDEIGLLSPSRIANNKYRIYTQKEVDLLQQILFYRELSIPLEEIKQIIHSLDFDKNAALQHHLSSLLEKKEQIELLIQNVEKTICSMREETSMSNKEKFEGFKKKVIEENEAKYGAESREKYGDEEVNASNAKLAGMSEETWNEAQRLNIEISSKLKQALEQGNPASELAQEVCKLHETWLKFYWKDGMYSKEAHKGLGEMYVADERFKKYYDQIAVGAAEFLRDALEVYCS